MLKKDLEEMEKLDKIIVFADKSNNLYCLDKYVYLKEARNNITKDYKLSSSANFNIVTGSPERILTW